MLKRMRRSFKRNLSFLKRRFIEPAPPKNAGDRLLLHIGCGPIKSPEFINIDAVQIGRAHV